ncbi:MAG: hypothetical protein AAGE85_07430, partial [Pseudomonadota bacterium]
SFAVLNLFIALIVNSMNTVHAEDRESAAAAETIAHDEREHLMDEVRALRADLKVLTERLESRPADTPRQDSV